MTPMRNGTRMVPMSRSGGCKLKTLTKEQCVEWLAARNVPLDPYYTPEVRPEFYDQFSLTEDSRSTSGTFRSILACIGPFEGVLLEITSCVLYEPDEME